MLFGKHLRGTEALGNIRLSLNGAGVSLKKRSVAGIKRGKHQGGVEREDW